ncbi:hydrogenase maturation protease [Dongshaea marina]|uniref:hydrogenase maturation protease n=1 Tax=Dongshaea marina TaxID=2047966 RepID=UPI000D3E5197|nr:hydrogenase maturation protease [Dongshaea marina]
MAQYTQYLLGVGNSMMSDDGIGPAIVDYLADHYPDIKFGLIDVGGDSLKVLHYLEEEIEELLIVDSALMGLDPGEFDIFSPGEVISHKEIGAFSTHAGDVLKVIETGRRLGYPIPHIRIMGIEPVSLEQGMTLSDTLRWRMPEYARAAIRELTRSPCLNH